MTERLDFRVDIEQALKSTEFPSSDFKLVSPYEYEKILIAILDRFTTLGKKGLNCSWLWNSFKDPKSSIQLDYPPSYLKKEWVLCENHHEILMGVGSPMVEKIERLRSSFGNAISTLNSVDTVLILNAMIKQEQ